MAKLRLDDLLARRSPREPYCPDQGDMVKLQFSPIQGREQAGRRPALVLSPRKYNELAQLCVVCPMTNQAKGYPFEVKSPPTGDYSTILADQVKSVSWKERDCEFIQVVPSEVLQEVQGKLKALLLP